MGQLFTTVREVTGLNHEQRTDRCAGRDVRFTDDCCDVVKRIMA